MKEDDGSGMLIGIIAGVVGVVAVAAIIAVVVLVVVRKRRANGKQTAPFIPLSKKDFTPLIFGEQDSTSAEERKNAGNIAKLEELLLQEDLLLAHVICEVTQITEADKIAKALVIVFEAHNKTMQLLKALIVQEVKTTGRIPNMNTYLNSESAGTLFRSNSMVSKMFKFYSRLIGLPYLYETVGPELNQQIWENLGLEVSIIICYLICQVDPERMEEGADLNEMRWMLMAQSQKVLKAILKSVDRCPPYECQVFDLMIVQAIQGVVSLFERECVHSIPRCRKQNDWRIHLLEILLPCCDLARVLWNRGWSYNLDDSELTSSEPPSPSSRRLLILMTKTLQNLSNNVEFGSKEPYMAGMNDFIRSNVENLDAFFNKLVVC